MRLSDQFSFIRKNLKRNRLRLFMTIFASTIACAFLIVLASVGFGFQKSITDDLLANRTVTEIDVHGKKEGKSRDLSQEDIQFIKKTKDVQAVTVTYFLNHEAKVSIDDRYSQSQLDFHNMEEERKSKLELSKGNIPQHTNEVIVGYDFAKSLLTESQYKELTQMDPSTSKQNPQGYDGELLGKTLTITSSRVKNGQNETKQVPVTVVGITSKPTREWMEDRSIILPEELKQEFADFFKEDDTAKEREKQIPIFTQKVKAYAGTVEQVQAISNTLKENGFLVFSISDELKQLNTFFTIFKAGLILVGTIAVFIASIGIFNTMTMAVTERTQEIGILKAIGGEPAMIRKLFLIESAWIGLLGSCFGVVIAYLVSFCLNRFLPIILKSLAHTEAPQQFIFSYIPLSLVIISVAISLSVAILSGVRPAVKATKIKVLTALRREL
ncbi:ABC transporter permease [Ectobacillus polymachus]|uniref:ABC transporter permease n=1 Tax=Ectobacillus polymachus TaxID=1508806 RepID=UPI003A85E1CF